MYLSSLMIYVVYIHYIHVAAIILHTCAYIVRGDYRAVCMWLCTSFFFYYNENCLAYTQYIGFSRALLHKIYSVTHSKQLYIPVIRQLYVRHSSFLFSFLRIGFITWCVQNKSKCTLAKRKPKIRTRRRIWN